MLKVIMNYQFKKVLRELYKKQPNILLVSRLTDNSNWADRCYYLGEDYDQEKHYNHRLILTNEIVIEFDHEDRKINEKLINIVSKRLTKIGFKHSVWFSGNKSYHLHTFIDLKNANSPFLLKKIIVKDLTSDLEIKPDYRLINSPHLVRMEYGLNEKTGVYKSLIYKTKTPYKDNKVPHKYWVTYVSKKTTNVKRQTTKALNDVGSCDCVKHLSDVVEFRKHEDGRERALFILIHTLKDTKSKEELTNYLIDWYKYSGGYKLTAEDITRKVNYHYNRTYGTYRMIKELMFELGVGEIFNQCPVHGEKRKGDV